MKNQILAICLSIALIVISGASGVNADARKDPLTIEYNGLGDTFKENLKSIKTRDGYKKLVDEHNKGLEALLEKVKKAASTDAVELLKGKLLLDLRKPDESLKVLDALIAKNTSLTNAAKFVKVRVLVQGQKNHKDGLVLFRQIEKSIEKDQNYFWILGDFAFSSEDNAVKEEYSKKFIAEAGANKEFQRYIPMAYQTLADIAKEQNDIPKAIKILEEADAKVTDPRGKNDLKSALGMLKLYGSPAPEIDAQNWLNTPGNVGLKLADLKGKAVVIDFWATWCGPCRTVMPTLVKSYNQYKDKGLVVIGFTRIYGGYSDDQGKKGKVSPDEERKLIKGFLERHKITYPIAIEDGSEIFKKYNVSGIPMMVLIDKKGNIKDIRVGAGDESKLEENIAALLK